MLATGADAGTAGRSLTVPVTANAMSAEIGRQRTVLVSISCRSFHVDSDRTARLSDRVYRARGGKRVDGISSFQGAGTRALMGVVGKVNKALTWEPGWHVRSGSAAPTNDKVPGILSVLTDKLKTGADLGSTIVRTTGARAEGMQLQ